MRAYCATRVVLTNRFQFFETLTDFQICFLFDDKNTFSHNKKLTHILTNKIYLNKNLHDRNVVARNLSQRDQMQKL